MNEYCCDKFKKIIEKPESAYGRDTTFSKADDVWWTDFSDGEYGDIELTFCPFCGTKLKNFNAKQFQPKVKDKS